MEKANLIHSIEEYAPLSLQADWDNSGIQIDCMYPSFKHLVVMLDITLENVKKAHALGADCILTHHPLSVKPFLLNKVDPTYRIVHAALLRDTFVYSAHTSLDSKLNGFSAWLAYDFKMKNLEKLDKENNFGLVGNLPEAISFSECVQMLLKFMPHAKKEDFRLIAQYDQEKNEKDIQKIAFCTGSGADLYSFAQEAEADIYITGDVKYHAALDVLERAHKYETILLDVGHFSLEEEMMRRLSEKLAQVLPIKVTFLPSTSPFTPLV